MRYYLIAGERSGDLHASNLIKALKQLDPNAEFQGFGGDEMQRAGVTISVHYRDLAVMGFLSLATSIFRILRYLKFCKADILAFKPDAVILVDYGGFNLRLAPFVKANQIPVLYYIPPKVWAWNQKRTYKLKQSIDKVYSILPFEKEFYQRFQYEVEYVGNPVLDATQSFKPRNDFYSFYKLNPDKKLVALLPGSRAGELKRIVPLMAEVVSANPNIQFALAAVNNLSIELYNGLRGLPNVTWVEEDAYNILTHADAAIVTSGTATLETGIFKVPQVVVYKTGQLEYWLVKSLVKVKFISLVNLIAGKRVIHEFIQHDANATMLNQELNRLLFDTDYIDTIQRDYESMYQMLNTGSASKNAARLINEYLVGRKN